MYACTLDIARRRRRRFGTLPRRMLFVMAGDARESLGGGSNGGYSGVYGISRREGLACDNPELSYLEYKFVAGYLIFNFFLFV